MLAKQQFAAKHMITSIAGEFNGIDNKLSTIPRFFCIVKSTYYIAQPGDLSKN